MSDFEGKTPEQLAHMLEESITQLRWAITKVRDWDKAFDFYEHFGFETDEATRKITLVAKTALGLRMLNPPRD